VLGQNLRLFFRLYRSPRGAMAGILDEGSLLFGALAVLVVSFILHAGNPAHAFLATWSQASVSSMLGTLVSLALLYVPTALLIVTLADRVGSFGVVMGRDYGPLLACTFFAWAAARLPFALVSLVVTPLAGYAAAGVAWILGALAFGGFMIVALRTVFPARLTSALLAVALAPLAFLAESFIGYLASPFLLYLGYMYFRGDVSDLTRSFGARQGFKRHLEAATLNPRDSSAHYNLGLLHQQRRQYKEAIERFERAVEIDPGELDAHYQLGRIAREQKRWEDAIRHFEAVVAKDDRFSRYEIWREVGATYVESESFDNARWALDKFVANRGHDPEGLCLLGEMLARGGDRAVAREHFERCIEAADTMPAYRRGEVRGFRKRAAQGLAAFAK
jgi:tetratricopeptide (TPR) repeat protein